MGWAPWAASVSLGSIDVAYHGERSGGKFVSPIIYHFIDNNGELDHAAATAISNMLRARYEQKWDHLWSIYSLEYGILDSYNISEIRHRELTRDEDVEDQRTLNLTDTHTHPTKTVESNRTRTPDLLETTNSEETGSVEVDETDTTTHGHIIVTEGESSSTVSDSKYGFNSAAAVPTNEEVTEGSNSSTETHSGNDVVVKESDTSSLVAFEGTVASTGTETNHDVDTERYSGNDVVTNTGTDTRDIDGNVLEDEDSTVTKIGNIFKSPAELMMADRDFWLTDFFSIIFDDVDQMLTLAVYPERRVRYTVITDPYDPEIISEED